MLPDGDCHIVLAADFSWGCFGRPWEQTICVFGRRLLAAVERSRPTLLVHTVRRH